MACVKYGSRPGSMYTGTRPTIVIIQGPYYRVIV